MVNWFIYILLAIILLFLVYFFGGRESIQVNELTLNEEYSYFENDQGKTAFYSTGKNESEPLILIHGVSVPSYYYKKIATSLSQIGYKVYTVSYTHLTLPTTPYV